MGQRLYKLLWIGGLTFLSILLLAQQPDSASITTFTSNTELVLVPTVVVDRQGKHIRTLANIVDDGQPKALVVFTLSGIHVLHDFTTDPQALATTLRKVVSNSPNLNAQDAAKDPLYEKLSDFRRATNWIDDEFRDRIVLESTETCFRQIATAFSGVPGRKALIWVTAGFPFTTGSPKMGIANFPNYDRTWRMMNSANVAIYPIDVRDVAVPGFDEARNRHVRVDQPYLPPAPPLTTDRQLSDLRSQQTATMINFARETGGKSCVGRLDLVECFHEAQEESGSYYMLGYYLNHQNTKPGWHKLDVKTKVHNATLRSRNGFNVTTPAPQDDLKSHIEAAVTSPLDYTALPVAVKWASVSDGRSGAKHVKFELVMPPGAFELEEQDHNRMDLEVLAVSRLPDGRAILLRDQEVQDHFKDESAAKIKHDGMRYHDALDVAPGNYNVRFVIRDNVSRKIGSVTAPLKVE